MNVTSSPSRRDLAIAALAALPASALLIAHARLIYAPCDDAYIYLVYVRSVLSGHGLTYNGELVEGFSSLLWPWLIAALGSLGLPLPAAMEGLSLASGCFALFSVCFVALRIGVSRPAACLTPLLVALTGDFAFYSGNGLETPLFVAWMAWVVWLLFVDDPRKPLASLALPLLLFAGVLIRPEALLVDVVVMVWLAGRARSFAAATRAGLALLVAVVATIVALRLIYGHWTPATYAAKSGSGLANLRIGLGYAAQFAIQYAPLLALAAAAFAFRWRVLSPAAAPLLLLIVAWVAQVAIQGGDNMVGLRMFLPLTPLLWLVAARAFGSVPLIVLVPAAACLGASVYLPYGLGYGRGGDHGAQPVAVQMHGWRESARDREAVGKWLARNMPPDAAVALNAAGITPYWSGLPTIDMLGLNNAHIAHQGRRDRTLPYGHQSGDGVYVLDQRPGAILMGADGSPNGYVSDREIWADARLKAGYRLCQATSLTRAWVRNDLRVEAAGADC